MSDSHAILIVGGYGIVGSRIARNLAADYPNRVMPPACWVARRSIALVARSNRSRPMCCFRLGMCSAKPRAVTSSRSCRDPYPVVVDGGEASGTAVTPPRAGAVSRAARSANGIPFPFLRSSLLHPDTRRALSGLVGLRAPALLARRRDGSGPTQRLTSWLQRRYAGHDWYGLVVEASGKVITALGAAAIARTIVDGQVSEPGIWVAEQLVPPGPVSTTWSPTD